MKLEKLDYGKSKMRKGFLYGFIMCAILLIILNLFTSKAKYKQIDKVELIRQNITYSAPDLNIMGVYLKNEGEEEYTKLQDTIPTEGYELDKQESYCTISNDPTPIKNIIDYQDGKIIIETNKRNTKCFLYFDEKATTKKVEIPGLGTLAVQLEAPSSFKGTACAPKTQESSSHTSGDCTFNENGIYEGTDDYGPTYYYRGTINNNWVSFANKSWRIIRINGDGTIRLIYAGNGAPNTVADTTTIPESSGLTGNGYWSSSSSVSQVDKKAYNTNYEDNAYVGYRYGSAGSSSYDATHKNTNDSDIKAYLESWYTNSGLSGFADKIEESTGFCNDRTPYQYGGITAESQMDKTKYGFGATDTRYGAYLRNRVKYEPSFECPQKENDLFTMKGNSGKGNGSQTAPIGLITADEVAFAGAYGTTSNYGYWLWTGALYWTMSPCNASSATVFNVNDNGNLDWYNVSNTRLGVRPVINLKANTTFKAGGNGTINNPYVVS